MEHVVRKKTVAGNWKMNGSLTDIEALLAKIEAGMSGITCTSVVVCPPLIYLPRVSQLLKDSKVSYGAQDVSDAPSGAYTGEVSAGMLKDFSCQYAIVGHSERRNIRGESDELVARKFKAAQDAGITPILCVGELLEQREAGDTLAIVGKQIDAVIDLCGVDALAQSIIAYEPVWAIGTGQTASPSQAQEVHADIRTKIAKQNQTVAENIIIQYGGSMNASNAEKLLSMADIDGGLIGGASLKSEDFLTICRAAEKLSTES